MLQSGSDLALLQCVDSRCLIARQHPVWRSLGPRTISEALVSRKGLKAELQGLPRRLHVRRVDHDSRPLGRCGSASETIEKPLRRSMLAFHPCKGLLLREYKRRFSSIKKVKQEPRIAEPYQLTLPEPPYHAVDCLPPNGTQAADRGCQRYCYVDILVVLALRPWAVAVGGLHSGKRGYAGRSTPSLPDSP